MISQTDTLTALPSGPLQGVVGGTDGLPLPGDKSISHRAALLGAMAEGETIVRNFLVSGVTEAMLSSLASLGVPYQLAGRTLTVTGVGLGDPARGRMAVLTGKTLYCGSSATTLRLLAGALAGWGAAAVLDGSPGLRRRPMRRIIDPLARMGVAVESDNGCAPLRLGLAERRLRGLEHKLAVASAQVKSCILLAALTAEGETVVNEPGPSRDHTERMLRAMGVDVFSLVPDSEGPRQWTSRVRPADRALEPLNITLPGDPSAAAFLIVAALIRPRSDIIIRGVGLNPTRTGLLDTLLEMGAYLEIHPMGEQAGEPVGDIHVRGSELRGVSVSGDRVVRMIDEFPAFAIAAACAEGQTVVADAAELRTKESDRIAALGHELRRLGISFDETEDGFCVDGGRPILGGEVESHGDHRLAMALLVAGLGAAASVRVSGAGMLAESYPEFAQVLTGLGARLV